jgi:DNA modification methylase
VGSLFSKDSIVTLSFLPEQIERWPLARLVPYARNARTHSEDQVAKIAASLIEFGWTVPILVDDAGEVIAGHGRILAAQQLDITEVPVIRLGHLTPEQVRGYRIADNQLTLLGEWDEAALAEETHWLNGANFDLGLLGFSEEELQRLMAPLEGDGEGLADEDEIPEPPAEPVTRPGDLWQLGDHRLLCGDSTSADDVVRLLDGVRPHLLVSDPPYGVQYAPGWRNEAGVSSTARTGAVRNDDRADWREAWALFPGDVAYVWHAGIHGKTVADSLESCGFAIRAQLIWVKTRFVLSRGHYHWRHEPCFYAVRDGGKSRWQGARDQSTVWEIATNTDDDMATVHGTQKPVECMLRPILNNSARGDTVYEPFAGSGTTFIAAEKSDRRCVGIEIEPRYCDVIIERWQNVTSRRAVLDGDARTFDEVASERLPRAA